MVLHIDRRRADGAGNGTVSVSVSSGARKTDGGRAASHRKSETYTRKIKFVLVSVGNKQNRSKEPESLSLNLPQNVYIYYLTLRGSVFGLILS